MLANNIRTNFAQYTYKMKKLTLMIIQKVKKDGIKIVQNTSFLNTHDAEFINESYASA